MGFRHYRLCEYIAAIIGKTYAECGDAAVLPDDDALMMIRDFLLFFDESIIERNKERNLKYLRSTAKTYLLRVDRKF